MTNTTSTPSSSAQWHTVSPHTRPLTLTVLELTPLALTLSLSLTPPALPSHSHSHPTLPHVVHNNHHTHAQSPSHSKSKKRAHAATLTTPRAKRSGDVSEEEDEDLEYSSLVDTSSSSSFKDLLSHGVVVSVNGQPWSRIYAHVSEDEDDNDELDWEDEEINGTNTAIVVNDEGIEEGSITRRRPRKPRFASSALSQTSTDKDLVLSGAAHGGKKKGGKEKMDKDRAVVVVYGLSPGKEYEVELRVVGLFSQEGGEGLVSTSVLIPPSPTPNTNLHPRSRANSLRSRSRPRSRSNSLTGGSPGHPPNSSPLSHTRSSDAVATLDSLASGSHDTLSPDTAAIIPTPVLNAVDTQTAQLRHLIATAHAEKEHLQTQIKEARRTSQRQEAALKAEIENVKKAIEKAGSMDLRSKQKALATQEQVKQGWAGAESAEKDASDVESGLDTLESKLEALNIEVEAIQLEWKSIKDREEEFREKDKKTRLEEDKKLAEVLAKIDKLKSKKAKKQSEQDELEKQLKDLETKIKDQEKKNTDDREKAMRKNSNAASYHAAGYGSNANNDNHEYGFGGQRSLSAHPSLNNLNSHYAAGPAYRPRGGAGANTGYQPRFPSAGSTFRPSPSQPQPAHSPTHPNNFYQIQHPVPPNSNTSPAFRPPKLQNAPSRSTSGPTPSSTGTGATPSTGGGVNAAALPFHPANFSPNNEPPSTGAAHHTTLMPPQLQHRIYLPNVRPRPTPNFHPPPSVLAEQAQAKSRESSGSGNSPSNDPITGTGVRSPNHSPPNFPPLPVKQNSTASTSTTGGRDGAGGPSLASIVTRAVLSPTSALAQQSQAANIGNVASSVLRNPPSSVQSPGPGGESSTGSPVPTPPTSARISSPATGTANSGGGGGEFPPLSPTWPSTLGQPIRREGTPPISIWNTTKDRDRDSPVGAVGNAVLRKPSRSGSGEGQGSS
ncbi:hypothetical protein I302_100114 [Kwoniella bestiolae CBS 10118]|uniref:Uncharacterized protein n=1 Tax=Kwoniella bestiolae CBS 10118 TaxID=1296100 RepID=A0A1B9G436_9TREE|nr:hypothetical protein I302_03490 [Kwoniella bestiolae CBS 10118]OCF25817.1 hypothetical protein I302_03490 [Kwoniella bestiolae CBS 10118]